jgi:hypothetical protein
MATGYFNFSMKYVLRQLRHQYNIINGISKKDQYLTSKPTFMGLIVIYIYFLLKWYNFFNLMILYGYYNKTLFFKIEYHDKI